MKDLALYVFDALLIGVFSFVYVNILTQPGKILGPLVKIIDPFFNSNKFLQWIYDPIINCSYCNAGQISLWTYLICYWNNSYSVFYHLGFIAISIITVHILIKKYGR